MNSVTEQAPGAPGIAPRWTSSAKDGVGTALNDLSPVWFTHSHGTLNEIYYPSPDSACTRDCELLVTAADGYFAEEKRDCVNLSTAVDGAVPAFRLTNTAKDGRFTITKEIVSDPARATVLQRIRFQAQRPGPYQVYALLAPHLVNAGANNTAWIATYKNQTILFASGQSRYLAMACSEGWAAATAGFVGVSDGFTQIKQAGSLAALYHRAEHGNVALTGEIAFNTSTQSATLAIGFGSTFAEAANNALASLARGFDACWNAYVEEWRAWQKTLLPLEGATARPDKLNYYRTSAAVLATHRCTEPRGAVVASLSIPWGQSKGDNDIGGYHLIWPRDLVEVAGGFLAAGDAKEALAILEYLRNVQAPSGRWPQNFWLDGTPYWQGEQMDECAFPILLADMLARAGHLTAELRAAYRPMIIAAAGYILHNGPVTGQDRWEEDGGYSPFTLAVEISALLAAADYLEASDNHAAANFLREVADCWNEQIENWTLAANDELTLAAGVKHYYVRMGGAAATDVASAMKGEITIRNREGEFQAPLSSRIISPDALALVRFGLRSPQDPRIIDTVKVIDHLLRKQVPQGPLWYRYNEDGYGEKEDGAPFDGTGKGRLWPLMAAERAHYELAAGNVAAATALLKTIEASTSPGGMMPEQIWDAADIPAQELFFGKPSGSAMPLAWGHAEHIKLLRSLKDGKVFDMPPQTVARYVDRETPSALRIWRFNNRITTMPAGKALRLVLGAPAMVHWSQDHWVTTTDSHSQKIGMDWHYVDLPVNLPVGGEIVFTFFWPEAGHWEGDNFTVKIL